jgi:glutamate synthase (NADPH/NADH) small chain
MSAFAFEYEHAKQEGVQFLWRVIPVQIHADASGIRSLECAQARVNDSGVLEAVEGTDFHFDCQQIFYAIGQSPLLDLLSSVRGIELSHGRVLVERVTGLTSNPKYFAGGDCVNGGREVVDAVADGKRAGVALAQAFELFTTEDTESTEKGVRT